MNRRVFSMLVLWGLVGLISCAKAEVSTQSGTLIQSLDGTWQSAQDTGDAGKTGNWFDPAHFPTSGTRPIQVPGTTTEVWETGSWSGDQSRNILWYTKTFTPSALPQVNMRYYLRFGAVMENSTVWLNGTELGEHRGGEDPFEFDATALLRLGQPNTVTLRINLWTLGPIPLGGINQHVTLVAQPEVRIIDVFARPDAKAGQIHLEVNLENNTKTPGQVDLRAVLGEFKPAKSLGSQGSTVTVPPGQTTAKLDLPVASPHLWDLNDPFLYTIAVTSTWNAAGGSVRLQDTYSFRTGFRDFRLVDGWFTLNGRRLFVKSLHGNWYDPVSCQGTPRDMTWLGQDFPLLKKAGFNMMRFIVSAALPEQLDQADELGLLIYSEHETSWLIHDPAAFGNTLNQVVCRDRNHPSLAIWGLLNETDNMDIYHRAKDWLPSLRAIDDTRTVLLSSGRWDRDYKTASASNPGSSTWDVYLGGEDPQSPKSTGDLRTGFSAYYGGTGDAHIYPSYPQTWDFITDFAKLDLVPLHPFFFSECGIGSQYDVFDEKRQMEKAHAPALSPSWKWINAGLEGLPQTWANYGLAETYPNMEDVFTDSALAAARQRELLFSIIRSNPNINGYNLTSLMDCWGGGEGVLTDFREFKPGHLQVLQEGWAPLRWCLLVNPMNAYADEAIHIKASLANEDFLPGGDYPATLKISGPAGAVWTQPVVAHVKDHGPFAYALFDADVRVPGLKAGNYTLEASLDTKPNAAANKLPFVVSSRADLPAVRGKITVAGVGQNVRDLLAKQGAQVIDYAPGDGADRQTILVGADFKGKASDWRALYSRAARGAHVVFLRGEVFSSGKTPNQWLALPAKGELSHDVDWLYHKDSVAKVNNPCFAGLPPRLMTPEFYGMLLDHTSYFHNMTNPAPGDTAAASVYSFLAVPNYRDGVMLATYPFHAGHFTINAFNIVNSIGSPATDRLLINLVLAAQADAAPLSPLPADYATEMDKLGFTD